MVIEDLSLLNILLLLLPFLLLGVLVALAVLGRSWRLKAEAGLKAALELLPQLQGGIEWATAEMSAFGAEDPEPYGSRVGAILPVLSSLQENAGLLNSQVAQLQEQVSRNVGFARLLSLLVPVPWYRANSQATILVQKLTNEFSRMDTLRTQVQGLSRLGWETALQARAVILVQGEARLLYERLRLLGFKGVEFDAMNARRRQVRSQLDQIPIFFLSADETEVTQLAERTDIQAAHACLEGAKLELEETIAVGCAWESGLAETARSVQAFSRSLAGTQRLMASSANLLDLSEQDRRLLLLHSLLHDLQAFMAAPEIENLAEIQPQAQQALAELKGIQDQVGRSRQVLLALTAAFTDARTGLQEVAGCQQALVDHASYPLELDLSGPKARELQNQVETLAADRGLPQPAALPGKITAIQLVTDSIRALLSELSQLDQLHGEMQASLSVPAYLEFESWLLGARRLVERLQVYDQQNFSSPERISDLPTRLDAVENQWRLLQSNTVGVAIPESRLHQLLGDARAYLGDRQDLDQQLERLQKDLVALEQNEVIARAVAEDAQAALGQIAFLVRSNPFLAGIAPQELARQQAEVKNLGLLLAERGRGKVADKARLAAALARQVRKSAFVWLDALGKETQAMTLELSLLLTEIDALGKVEEAVVDQARQLLSETPPALEKAVLVNETSPLVQLIPEFKRRCDFWQRCVGVSKELIELAAPLKRAAGQAAGHQQQVSQALASASAWMSQRESWPPSAVDLRREQAGLQDIDLRWQALRSRPLRLIQLVQELGELSTSYQSLWDKIQAGSDQAAREMRQVEEVEADLHELAGLWQSQWYAYRENAAVSLEIKTLLDDTEKNLKSIKHLYKRRQMDYDQVMEALKNLYRKLRFYQVELDPGHALDAMGNIQSRR